MIGIKIRKRVGKRDENQCNNPYNCIFYEICLCRWEIFSFCLYHLRYAKLFVWLLSPALFGHNFFFVANTSNIIMYTVSSFFLESLCVIATVCKIMHWKRTNNLQIIVMVVQTMWIDNKECFMIVVFFIKIWKRKNL